MNLAIYIQPLCYINVDVLWHLNSSIKVTNFFSKTSLNDKMV